MKHVVFITLAIFLAACTPAYTLQSQTREQTRPMMHAGHGGMMHSMAPITSEEVFLREMIPHHQEAIDTAKLTLVTTENPSLKTLLENIIEDQSREIGMMESWLVAWHPNSTLEADYQPMMGDLASLEDVERDVVFLEGMIMHHHMAIMMAQHARTLELHPETAELAKNIITTQTAEITQMQAMLAAY